MGNTFDSVNRNYGFDIGEHSVKKCADNVHALYDVSNNVPGRAESSENKLFT